MPTVKLFFDDNYIPLFKNMLYSAMLYKEQATNFDLVIGVENKRQNPDDSETSIGGLTQNGKDVVLKFCRLIGVSVTFEEILSSEEVFTSEDFQRNFTTMHHIPYFSLIARLIMFTNATEDFVYLDVDLIMQPGWDSIFSIEPQNSSTAIMAANDSNRSSLELFRSNAEHPQNWVMLETSNQDHYFNSGVMKFSYRAWKEFKISDKLISLLKKIERGEVTAEYADQDVINHITQNNFESLDETFNVLVSPWGGSSINNHYSLDKKNHPKILHYVGGVKPHAVGQSEKDELIHTADFNCENGFLDHTHNYFYTAFFIQNQRKLFEMNTK